MKSKRDWLFTGFVVVVLLGAGGIVAANIFPEYNPMSCEYAVKDAIRERMHDPSSLSDFSVAFENDKNDGRYIATFRAANGFGALRRGKIMGNSLRPGAGGKCKAWVSNVIGG